MEKLRAYRLQNKHRVIEMSKKTKEYKVDILSEAKLLLAVYHRAAAFGLYYSLFTLMICQRQ